MNKIAQKVPVTYPEIPLNLEAMETQATQGKLIHYSFHLRGVGSGSFSYAANSSSQQLDVGYLEYFPLKSFVWEGQEIELIKFEERNVYFQQGKLMGLNLLGEGWEIILNFGIKVNGVTCLQEVTYTQVEKVPMIVSTRSY